MLRLIFCIVCSLALVCCTKPAIDETGDPESEYVNLSEDGYANCYIVSKEGAYALLLLAVIAVSQLGILLLLKFCGNRAIITRFQHHLH